MEEFWKSSWRRWAGRISALEALLSLPLPVLPVCKYLSLLRSPLPLPLLQEASPDTSGTLRPSLWKDPMDPGESPQLYMCAFLHVHCILLCMRIILIIKRRTNRQKSAVLPWFHGVVISMSKSPKGCEQPKSRDYCFIPVELTQARHAANTQNS